MGGGRGGGFKFSTYRCDRFLVRLCWILNNYIPFGRGNKTFCGQFFWVGQYFCKLRYLEPLLSPETVGWQSGITVIPLGCGTDACEDKATFLKGQLPGVVKDNITEPFYGSAKDCLVFN